MTEHKQFIISEQCWHIMQQFAGLAYDKDKNEISGLLHVRKGVHPVDGEPVYELFDPIILEQENTGTTTELDGDAIRDYTIKAGMKYGKDIKFCWWHSHHTMGAFWSGTDENEIDAWENESFSLALVINLKEEFVFRVSLWKANELPIAEHYDTDLTIERKQPKIKVTEAMMKQYDELCDNKVHTIINGYRKPHQPNMFQRQEINLNVENYYSELLDKIDVLIDAYSDGSIGLKKYTKQIKSLNTLCEKHKLPFRVLEIKGNKQYVLNELMTRLAGDMIEWSDETFRRTIEETHIYNGGWGHGGY